MIRLIKKIQRLIIKLRKIDKIYVNQENQYIESQLRHYELLATTNSARGVSDKKRKHPLTVSLTTYGNRIHTVFMVIESLMIQSLKADRIVLWLADDEFSYEGLPEILKKQESRGLTIKFCKNIKSYKKLIPSLIEYPDDLIVTVDDDVIFPVNHLDQLYKAYLEEPAYIYCHRAHKIQFDDRGKLMPYLQWTNDYKGIEASLDIFPTGNAGILYFPGCFNLDVLNEELFMKLCPHADDVWLKFMSLRQGVACKVVNPSRPWSDYLKIPEDNKNNLWSINVNRNDEQIQAVLKYYPEIKFI